MFTVVIEVEMKLGFEQAVIVLGLCVIAAGFLYFCCVINLNRGFGKDHPEERLPDNHRQQRNKRRGRGRQIRGTDRKKKLPRQFIASTAPEASGERRASLTNGKQLKNFFPR